MQDLKAQGNVGVTCALPLSQAQEAEPTEGLQRSASHAVNPDAGG